MRPTTAKEVELFRASERLTAKDVICGFVCCLPFWYAVGLFWIYPMIVRCWK